MLSVIKGFYVLTYSLLFLTNYLSHALQLSRLLKASPSAWCYKIRNKEAAQDSSPFHFISSTATEIVFICSRSVYSVFSIRYSQ